MPKLSLSLSVPFVGISYDVPVEKLIPRRLFSVVSRERANAAVAKVVDVLFKDQYGDQTDDAAGAWSKRYPVYLEEVYRGHPPTDVSVRDSISCSAWIAFALRHLAQLAQHESFTQAVGNCLSGFEAYLLRHFNDDVGAFGMTVRPNSIGERDISVDLRHTSWALLYLAQCGSLGSEDHVRKAASYVRNRLENMRPKDERAVTYAVLHRVLTTSPSCELVVPSASARLAILKRLESRLVECFDESRKTWDMRIDPPQAALRNALFVLYCVDAKSLVDDDCRRIFASVLHYLLNSALPEGVPLVDGASPDAGLTATLAYICRRDHAIADVSLRKRTKLMRRAIDLVETRDISREGYPWHLASLLLLSDAL